MKSPSGATYTAFERTLSGGIANANTLALYDSSEYLRYHTGGGATTRWANLGRASRAEGKRACIKACQCTLIVRPSAWAINNVMEMGARLIIAEQIPLQGAANIPADYSMWTQPVAADPHRELALWANMQGMLAEKRWAAHFGGGETSNTTRWTLKIAWRGKRYLRPGEGLFLYLEHPTGVATLIDPVYRTFCRTLVVDEG